MNEKMLNISSVVEELKVRVDFRLAQKLKTIDAEIDEFLKSAIQKIILATLGLRHDSFRGFEIDRVNGREPEISRLIASKVSGHVDTWLAGFTWPDSLERKLVPKLELAIRRDYERALRDKLNSVIKQRAEAEAIKQAEALFEAVMQAPEISGLSEEAEAEEVALLQRLMRKYPKVWSRAFDTAVDRRIAPRDLELGAELDEASRLAYELRRTELADVDS